MIEYLIPTDFTVNNSFLAVLDENEAGLPGNNGTGTEPPPEFISAVEFLFTGVGMSVMALIGVTGNLLSLVVLTRRKLRSSVTLLLIGLTCTDTLFLISLFTLSGSKALVFDYFYGIGSTAEFYSFVTSHCSIIIDFAQTCSYYFTVAITLDRYIAVCWPFKARLLCTWSRAKYVAAVVMVLSIAYQSLANLFLLETPEEAELRSERVRTLCNLRRKNQSRDEALLRVDTFYESHFLTWPYLIFMALIPFSTLVVLNSLIYRRVRQANRERQAMTKQQTTDISFAVVVITIVVIFLCCNAAFFLMATLQRLSTCTFQRWKAILISTDTFLVSVNSASNFLIYVAMGTKFRRELLQILRQCPAVSRCIPWGLDHTGTGTSTSKSQPSSDES